MTKISIIVPNYNTEKYLPRCLDSLINQTFKDIEIILIDDGSNDNSLAIMKKYAQKDKRIKVIKQVNSGTGCARNQGLKNATGKYLMFCDSDDWYEPDMCQIMYQTIEEKNVDVVCCHNLFDFDERLSQKEKEERLDENYYNPKKFGKYDLNDKCILSTNVMLWNKIWRKSLIKQYDIRFPERNEYDDDAFWYMYGFVAKNIFYLTKPLYHYFLRLGSIMSTKFHKHPKNRMDGLLIADYVMQFLLDHHLNNYTLTIGHIFYIELKNSSQFFTKEEFKKNCQEINKKLRNKLGIKNRIVCDKKICIFLKEKSISRLIFEWVWYRIAIKFWTFIKTPQGRKKRFKYIRRIHINQLYWNFSKGIDNV